MQLFAALRALAHRGASTLVILAVAVVAAAAAATGPIYFAAAQVSILHDTASSGDVTNRGFEADQTGPVRGLQALVRDSVLGELTVAVGGPAAQRRLFAPPIESLESTGEDNEIGQQVQVVWRSGVCAQLRLLRGSCPTAANQVIISQYTMTGTGWHLGQRIQVAGFAPLTITGVYRPVNLKSDYWFDRSQLYFPLLEPAPAQSVSAPSAPQAGASPYDALFTVQATMNSAAPTTQGTCVLVDQLKTTHLVLADVPRLRAALTALANSNDLAELQILITSNIAANFTTLQESWQAVEVPVFLITVQLLMLSWLLLFLCVTDAVAARGPEVALAKLRGHGRLRTIAFGLSEPVALLGLALPLGVAAGWAANIVLAKVLLSPGTPVGLPWQSWAAAGTATAGGLAAVIFAARRTLRLSVAEQWRRSGRRATDRGWVLDAILLTGAAAGLLNLELTGKVSAAQHSVLSLLVPGLLGLAVAVAASRVLPLACRALYPASGRRGRFGLFLAVRHIARRPGGVRTTIVLATAFALATFAVTAWSVNRDNYALVADTQVGAPTVLTVITPAGRDLGAIVDQADPTGKKAAAVDAYTSLNSGNTSGVSTLAVDPQRFAAVANWRPSFAAQPLRTLMARIDPPAPTPPLVLTGDAFRVKVRVNAMSLPGEQFSADVTLGASPVSLGLLPGHGTVVRTGELVGCPCVLQDLRLSRTGAQLAHHLPPAGAIKGSLTLISLQVRQGLRWRAVGARALTSGAAWRAGHADQPPDQMAASAGGLTWNFTSLKQNDQVLDSANRPIPLPAIAAVALVGKSPHAVAGVGIDGTTVKMAPVMPVAAVPGAPSYGFIVDRQYAELTAGEDLSQVNQEVWLAAGAQPTIEPRLRAAGVKVVSVASSAAAAQALERQGPALASVLFLADAAAAALLASGAAILVLYLSARRRRYEYAALAASGVNRRTLRRSVLAELAVVLGYGMIVGVLAGLAAAVLALRSVPEFISDPAAPPLNYLPAPVPLAVLLGAAAGLLIVTAVVSSTTLILGVRLDQLREAPA